jgi:hypothetical protein
VEKIKPGDLVEYLHHSKDIEGNPYKTDVESFQIGDILVVEKMDKNRFGRLSHNFFIEIKPGMSSNGFLVQDQARKVIPATRLNRVLYPELEEIERNGQKYLATKKVVNDSN